MGGIGRVVICIRIKDMVRVKDRVKDKDNMALRTSTVVKVNTKVRTNTNIKVKAKAKVTTSDKVTISIRAKVKVSIKANKTVIDNKARGKADMEGTLVPMIRVNTIKDSLLVVKVNYHLRHLLRGIILRTSSLTFPPSPNIGLDITPGLT